jgi:hypothetical protein
MISVLGGSLAEDGDIRSSLLSSVESLRSRMSQTGAIPNNVDPVSGRPNFRAYADAGLWWIIGSNVIAPDVQTSRRVLEWYACQDVDQSGLLSMQESTDWQDLFCTRGKGLYLNCLYVLALESAARLDISLAQQYRIRANQVRNTLNAFVWYQGDGDMRRHIAHTFSTESPEQQDSLGRKRYLPRKRVLVTEHYYLRYLGFRAVRDCFYTLGHRPAPLAAGANTGQT